MSMGGWVRVVSTIVEDLISEEMTVHKVVLLLFVLSLAIESGQF